MHTVTLPRPGTIARAVIDELSSADHVPDTRRLLLPLRKSLWYDVTMDKNTKDLWVKALRSGDYRQGQHQLRTQDDRFCCLGVLCDVFQKETGRGRWDGNHFELAELGTSSAFPPDYMLAELGLGVLEDVLLREGEVGWALFFATMNDYQGRSFSEIADYIEANL
jgi:hypothetical protein